MSPEPDSSIPADGTAASKMPGGSCMGAGRGLDGKRLNAGERIGRGRPSAQCKSWHKACSPRQAEAESCSQSALALVRTLLLSSLRPHRPLTGRTPLATPSERRSAPDLHSSRRPHAYSSTICLSVGTSSGMPTACQGFHRPARGCYDDPKALFKAGRHVDR